MARANEPPRRQSTGHLLACWPSKDDLFIDKKGNLCTSRCHEAQASRRLYLVLEGSEMRFTCSIGHATLLSDPSQLLQRVIEMVQINCEHCARIELGTSTER